MDEDIIRSTVRIALLPAIALVCSPCSKIIVELALLFSNPSLLGMLAGWIWALAFIGTVILALWMGLCFSLKIWIE